MHADRSHNIEDASSVTVTFASGVVANILSGCYFDWSETPADVSLTVYADGVRLTYDWDHSLTVLHQHSSETYSDRGPYHPAALDAFIRAVKTGDRSLIRSDYSDGAKTLALTLAANRSLETGEVVLL
jgi:phage baseplate assembly protein gpV